MNKTLKTLLLMDNHFGDEGVIEFAEGLASEERGFQIKFLENLDLSSNYLTDLSGKRLAAGL